MNRLEGLEFQELTALDLGCGSYASVIARQVLTAPWKHLVSIDGYAPNIEKLKGMECAAKSWTTLLKDVREVEIAPQFDVVLSFDVLEHMTKEDGSAWLKKLEQIARRRIVLFFPVEPDDFHRPREMSGDEADNVLQDHLSHWKAHELKSLGYTVEEIFDCHQENQTIKVWKDDQFVDETRRISFGAVWATKNL